LGGDQLDVDADILVVSGPLAGDRIGSIRATLYHDELEAVVFALLQEVIELVEQIMTVRRPGDLAMWQMHFARSRLACRDMIRALKQATKLRISYRERVSTKPTEEAEAICS
jgi:hypothetical protein